MINPTAQGEVRTQVVKWNSVCSSVHGVMSELLLAAELGALSKADFSKLTTKLYTQVGVFAGFQSNCIFVLPSSAASLSALSPGWQATPTLGKEGVMGGKLAMVSRPSR